MATIPRTYLTTSKDGLNSVPLINGQVISIWDSDEVWYDAPNDGTLNGTPVRRKISGVKVVSSLPTTPLKDIVYVYIGNHGTLPGTDQLLYDLRVWNGGEWLVVGTNRDDTDVKAEISDSRFYLVGTSSSSTSSTGSLLKNLSVYVENGVLNGDLIGNADTATEATHAASATLATKAINDNASTPKPITGYLNSVSSDATSNLGSTLTFTKGDGTTTSVRTKDTTYSVFNSTTAGLVNKTSTTVSSDSTNLLLSGSGWIAKDNIVISKATSADNDGDDQEIVSTYIKSASYSTSTHNLTVTYGDDHTSTVSIPDTTYSVFSTSANGLVPKPSSAETAKILRGDGTWQAPDALIADYTGATTSASGVHGLVPAATSSEVGGFLRGDGEWGSTFDTNNAGLVPAPSTSSSDYCLRADGTWKADSTSATMAGAEDSDEKLFLVGSESQGTSEVTYSNENVYIDDGVLYSNNTEVVNLSDTQALTNKTYEGMTLGDAASASVASAVDTSTAPDKLPTNSAIASYVSSRIAPVITGLDTKYYVIEVYDSGTATSGGYALTVVGMSNSGDGDVEWADVTSGMLNTYIKFRASSSATTNTFHLCNTVIDTADGEITFQYSGTETTSTGIKVTTMKVVVDTTNESVSGEWSEKSYTIS